MEKSPLAKAGVKVTPPNKYSWEQSFEALGTFVKGLLQWLDTHSMLDLDAYKYQALFLGMRLEGKALKWFDKTVKLRNHKWAEELSMQAVGEDEPPQGLTPGKLMDPPQTSVDPQQSSEVFAQEHPGDQNTRVHSPQTVPIWVQSFIGAAGAAEPSTSSQHLS
ncbi:hypothetical protein M422DRAFT_268232 [Sphaerobolus stellatus SS14]|uniref:Uncharacterized protein n=1 Tax=Sphaerobolus stellatus (strain SS14) TaxID=990650 RepID=A0A0C9U7C5_SPHS4|nr:hypothetical protein M422DRAFT_268232 [Sphaerobolus stellatus SS14]